MFDLGQWQKGKCETDQQWKDRRKEFKNSEQTCERNGGKWEGTGHSIVERVGDLQYICVPNNR